MSAFSYFATKITQNFISSYSTKHRLKGAGCTCTLRTGNIDRNSFFKFDKNDNKKYVNIDFQFYPYFWQ